MNSIVTEQGYHPEKTEFFGSKFLIGNGYLGYRGTLEEYRAPQPVACTMSGLYDKNGGWREPVNAPDPLYIKAFFNGEALSVTEQQPKLHSQSLDLSCGLHLRQARFENGVEILSRRFASMSISDYILHTRIEEAKTLLTEGRSCSDVAHTMGFSLQSYFIRQFKKDTGMTPRLYLSLNGRL